MSRILKDIAELFFPPICPVCGKRMGEGARIVCTACRGEAPLTGFCREVDNPVVHKFWGLVPLVHACSFLYFVGGGGYRRLIHRFKYQGGWRLAQSMGEWFGSELAAGGLYAGVDVIVPVPLHRRRLLQRGYNQAAYLAQGMAAALHATVDTRSVIRYRYNTPQALRRRSERWENVKGIFAVRYPARLAGKHILLVDDVLTTGATIGACAEAILREVPDCRLSIATLAVSERSLRHGESAVYP